MDLRINTRAGVFLIILFISTICTAEKVYIPVSKVSGGESHTLILTQNGTFGCGNNYYWELGDNTRRNRHVPVQVHGVDDINYLQNVIEISAGYMHSLVLDVSHFEIYCYEIILL